MHSLEIMLAKKEYRKEINLFLYKLINIFLSFFLLIKELKIDINY